MTDQRSLEQRIGLPRLLEAHKQECDAREKLGYQKGGRGRADLLEACMALPTFDLEEPDAADFKDHAKEFITAMLLARAAIAKAECET